MAEEFNGPFVSFFAFPFLYLCLWSGILTFAQSLYIIQAETLYVVTPFVSLCIFVICYVLFKSPSFLVATCSRLSERQSSPSLLVLSVVSIEILCAAGCSTIFIGSNPLIQWIESVFTSKELPATRRFPQIRIDRFSHGGWTAHSCWLRDQRSITMVKLPF